ncbi:MAG: hypothetical protein ACLVJO_04800 [[Clostridium] scindens]
MGTKAGTILVAWQDEDITRKKERGTGTSSRRCINIPVGAKHGAAPDKLVFTSGGGSAGR